MLGSLLSRAYQLSASNDLVRDVSGIFPNRTFLHLEIAWPSGTGCFMNIWWAVWAGRGQLQSDRRSAAVCTSVCYIPWVLGLFNLVLGRSIWFFGLDFAKKTWLFFLSCLRFCQLSTYLGCCLTHLSPFGWKTHGCSQKTRRAMICVFGLSGLPGEHPRVQIRERVSELWGIWNMKFCCTYLELILSSLNPRCNRIGSIHVSSTFPGIFPAPRKLFLLHSLHHSDITLCALTSVRVVRFDQNQWLCWARQLHIPIFSYAGSLF